MKTALYESRAESVTTYACPTSEYENMADAVAKLDAIPYEQDYMGKCRRMFSKLVDPNVCVC
jgi:hypothetical protein